MSEDGSKKSSFLTKLLALGIVAVAILVVLKIVVNAISGTSLIIALGLIALGMGVVWAVRQLR